MIDARPRQHSVSSPSCRLRWGWIRVLPADHPWNRKLRINDRSMKLTSTRKFVNEGSYNSEQIYSYGYMRKKAARFIRGWRHENDPIFRHSFDSGWEFLFEIAIVFFLQVLHGNLLVCIMQTLAQLVNHIHLLLSLLPQVMLFSTLFQTTTILTTVLHRSSAFSMDNTIYSNTISQASFYPFKLVEWSKGNLDFDHR